MSNLTLKSLQPRYCPHPLLLATSTLGQPLGGLLHQLTEQDVWELMTVGLQAVEEVGHLVEVVIVRSVFRLQEGFRFLSGKVLRSTLPQYELPPASVGLVRQLGLLLLECCCRLPSCNIWDSPSAQLFAEMVADRLFILKFKFGKRLVKAIKALLEDQPQVEKARRLIRKQAESPSFSQFSESWLDESFIFNTPMKIVTSKTSVSTESELTPKRRTGQFISQRELLSTSREEESGLRLSNEAYCEETEVLGEEEHWRRGARRSHLLQPIPQDDEEGERRV